MPMACLAVGLVLPIPAGGGEAGGADLEVQYWPVSRASARASCPCCHPVLELLPQELAWL